MKNSSSMNPAISVEEGGKIFIGGIAREVDEGMLSTYFSKFGNVVLSQVMRDKFGVSRGFAFVAFDPPDVTREVLQMIHVIEGRTVECKQAMKFDRSSMSSGGGRFGQGTPGQGGPGGFTRGTSVSMEAVTAQSKLASRALGDAGAVGNQVVHVPRQVYVGGIPHGITEKQITDYFGQFGDVVSINLKYDFTQNPPKFRGFGFVNFVEESSVEKCIEQYSNHYLGGKWIEVKRSKHSHIVQSENSGRPLPSTVANAQAGRAITYDPAIAKGNPTMSSASNANLIPLGKPQQSLSAALPSNNSVGAYGAINPGFPGGYRAVAPVWTSGDSGPQPMDKPHSTTRVR